ncbi:MAG: hypothetical protein KGO53_13725 [Alphaproteobacteria bacterium]|nr:hypothetical protein [Alphaproteobacteria bacterium]
MKTLFRLIAFEFSLIRMLFFRVIFERLTNTFMAAFAGFAAVYYSAYVSRGVYVIDATPDNLSRVQGMILFSFLYAETIMANWQYTTNKTGRMELIFNSTQPPLRIIFAKSFASACITLASMIVLYFGPLAWFGLLGAFKLAFWLVAGATLFVCCAVMSFNAVFEFQLKQVKALTSMLNLVLPYLAMRYAKFLPESFGFLPYFNGARFLGLADGYGLGDVLWLYLTGAVTGLLFLLFAQMVVSRIRRTASVYLE